LSRVDLFFNRIAIEDLLRLIEFFHRRHFQENDFKFKEAVIDDLRHFRIIEPEKRDAVNTCGHDQSQYGDLWRALSRAITPRSRIFGAREGGVAIATMGGLPVAEVSCGGGGLGPVRTSAGEAVRSRVFMGGE